MCNQARYGTEAPPLYRLESVRGTRIMLVTGEHRRLVASDGHVHADSHFEITCVCRRLGQALRQNRYRVPQRVAQRGRVGVGGEQ